VFQYTYLFGAFSPITGDKFLLEMPYCSGDMFQLYLYQFSEQNPEEYKIIVLDNGAFHKCKWLKIPTNIALFFLPPYSPELNPAEKMWKHIKRKFTNRYFKSLNEISEFFTLTTNAINKSIVKSTCAFNYIFSSHFWSV
ncbi:MAG: IS630 family transposase, partial [Bacteroidetes bacterium]|nr:IS630 family transposase [Bacteroidota bacterium]